MIARAVATLLLLAALAPHGSAQSELERAERAYRLGDFATAAQRYAAALPVAGDRCGAVLKNLGNCAFRQQRFADAVLCYRRALLRLPDDAGARHNLALGERRLGLAAAAADPIARSPSPSLLVTAVVLQSLGFAGLLGRARTRRAIGGALLALGIAGAVAVARDQWAAVPAQAVALGPATLRIDATADAASVATLRAGECAAVVARSGAWLRVQRGDAVGWVEADALGIVD